MTFAAVGTGFTANGGTIAPAAAGDLVMVVVVSESATAWCTGLSGGNCTWTALGTAFHGTVTAWTATAFAGTVTAAGSAALSFTYNGTAPTIRADGMEFSSTAGSWALDTQGGVDASTASFPSLTPAAAGELYFGFAWDAGTAAAGSTAGFTFFSDVNGNGECWNPACGAGVQAPAWADTNTRIGLAVLMREVTAGPSAGADSGHGADAGPGPGPTPEIRGFPATARQWVYV